MKIKVDKKEYKELLERVSELEKRVDDETGMLFDNWRYARDEIYREMENYFNNQCMVVMMKRDKDNVVAEVRKKAMDNIFKEEK
jgi:hypothetical protein